jgi:hypothetical protein
MFDSTIRQKKVTANNIMSHGQQVLLIIETIPSETAGDSP